VVHAICAYGGTKAALNRYTQELAHELAGSGVFINGLAPENIVLTSGADYVRDIALKNLNMLESIEMMTEAALVLCAGQCISLQTSSRAPKG
jgi:citronellol/citronellal dehydrogenase